MTLGTLAHQSVLNLDQRLSTLLRPWERRGTLLTLFLHGLFVHASEASQEYCDPQQGTTVDHFRRCIRYFLERDYQFVSPLDLLQGLDPRKRHVLLTFDDGYYNNHHAQPILEELKVPALFFVSTRHVAEQKPFWWDVAYRVRRRAGWSDAQRNQELAELKTLTTERAEQHFRDAVGSDAFQIVSAVDRPFRPDELREFARSPWVFLGNHTGNHAILRAYDSAAVRSEIDAAQDYLQQLTGMKPVAIAYPNGSYSPEICAIARQAGLRLGFTTEPKKDYWPRDLEGDNAMLLGRFCLSGYEPIEAQCAYFRSDLGLSYRFHRLKKRLKG